MLSEARPTLQSRAQLQHHDHICDSKHNTLPRELCDLYRDYVFTKREEIRRHLERPLRLAESPGPPFAFLRGVAPDVYLGLLEGSWLHQKDWDRRVLHAPGQSSKRRPQSRLLLFLLPMPVVVLSGPLPDLWVLRRGL